MDPTTPTSELQLLTGERQPWHKPAIQRLEISTETRLRGGSTDDGDSLGLGDLP
jgi:hypothetical protein